MVSHRSSSSRLRGQHVLHIPLGQGRTALSPPLRYAAPHECAEYALYVHAGMVEESFVLAGHDRPLHGLGNLLERHHFAILRIEIGEFAFAVVVVEGGALWKAVTSKSRSTVSDGITALATLFAPSTAGRTLVATPPPTHSDVGGNRGVLTRRAVKSSSSCPF